MEVLLDVSMCLFSSVFMNFTKYVNSDPWQNYNMAIVMVSLVQNLYLWMKWKRKYNIISLSNSYFKLWKFQIKCSILFLYLFLNLEEALVIALDIDQKELGKADIMMKLNSLPFLDRRWHASKYVSSSLPDEICLDIVRIQLTRKV